MNVSQETRSFAACFSLPAAGWVFFYEGLCPNVIKLRIKRKKYSRSGPQTPHRGAKRLNSYIKLSILFKKKSS